MKEGIYLMDCIEGMKQIADNSIDACITDPPYELGFMGKKWDSTGITYNVELWEEAFRILKPGAYLLAFGGSRTYHRLACAIEDAGFEIRDMIEYVYGSGFPKSLNINKELQKRCTCGNIEIYERAKKNTEHNLRSLQKTDLSQTINIEKKQGEILQSELSEQSLQIQQFKSTEDVWRKQSILERRDNVEKNTWELSGSNLCEMSEGLFANGKEGWLHNATQIDNGTISEQVINENRSCTSQRPQPKEQSYREPCDFCKQYGTQEVRMLYEATDGIGSALKPAHEPIVVARKPISEKTLLDNFLKWGTGGMNIDECRIKTEDNLNGGGYSKNFKGSSFLAYGGKLEYEQPIGRFPANLLHDGSEEVVRLFPNTKPSKIGKPRGTFKKGLFANSEFNKVGTEHNDSGSAARFFYCAKASQSERNEGLDGLEDKTENLKGLDTRGRTLQREDGSETLVARWKGKPTKNNHPTVKPIALMKYLIKLVTREDALVLDPFLGSGTTGIACKNLKRRFIGFEKEEEYYHIAVNRVNKKEIQFKLNFTNEIP